MSDVRAAGTYFLGRYRVVDEIGIGGMASVHLARMDGPGGFQKWVAIKKIHPHLVEDESFVQMFLDEARIAARISHPNVATVFDLGKHEDTFWIAMEYLHGEPLREVMRRTEELGTAMPPEIACRVIADAAEGLHAAHELLGKNGEQLGLVHRDVTPHNLFVSYDGVTKVVDFGIAKFASREAQTRAGTLKGKLAYMSPEQVHGEGIDRRTDIFALGVVLWELTTGQRLFRMESDLDTLAKVQECNVPRPSTLIRGYPVDLEKIVMKALAKNRGERFRTARELSRALQSLLMRRGLFVASDEVAAYTQSIFADRIQKRDAHLRWAAEVTQTINVDQLLSKPKIGPEYTNSEVQAASQLSAKAIPPGPPRPAAGSPAPSLSVDAATRGPTNAPPTFETPSSRREADPLLNTGPSMATAPRPTGPAPNVRPPQAPTPRPPNSKAPRPAAGAPPTMPPPLPPSHSAHSAHDEPHPADGDGPTIQAGPGMLDAITEDPSTTGRRGPPRSEPPTLMEAPTGVRGQVLPALDAEPDLLEEDGDETIVAAARGDGSPLQAPPMFPQPARPSMSSPLAQERSQHNTSPPGPRFAQTAAIGGGGPSARPMAPPTYGGGPAHTGEVAFADAMGIPQTAPLGMGPDPHGPTDFGRHDPFGRDMMPGSMHPSQQGLQPFSRMGSPSYNGTMMTSQRGRRRPPMWVVAALSCSIALLIAGLVVAVVMTASTPSKSGTGTKTDPSAAPGTSAGATTSTTGTGTGATTPTATATTAAKTDPPPHAPPTVTVASPPDPTPPPQTGATTTPAPTAQAGATTAARPTTTPVSVNGGNGGANPTGGTKRPTAPTGPVAAPASGPAALGAITVVCMPKCTEITDNGAAFGTGNVFNKPVTAGRHALVLFSATTGVRKPMVVDVASGQTAEVRVSMEK